MAIPTPSAQITITRKKGFTLIELLVVVSILAILGAATFFILNPVAQFNKANDARRKSDLGELQKALDLYYQDKGAYPANSPSYQIAPGGTPVAWGAGWAPYMTKLPTDPTGATRLYVYYQGLSGQSYYIYTHLDQGSADPQACNGGGACASMAGNSINTQSCGNPQSASTVCNYGVSSPNTSP